MGRNADMCSRFNWYRVEVSSGSAVSCMRVERIEDERATCVFYVIADSDQDAKTQAVERYREAQRNATRARREQYANEGLCRCGCKRDVPGLLKCSRCNKRDREAKARSALRACGHSVPSPSKVQAFAETRQAHEREIVKQTLLEVREAWNDAPDYETFVLWLAERLEDLGVTK